MAQPVNVSFPSLQKDLFSKAMIGKGFPFGFIFSASIAFAIAFSVFMLKQSLISEIFSEQTKVLKISNIAFIIITIALAVILFGLIFWAGLRFEDGPDGVKQNERGLQLFFGQRTRGESPEGLYWLIPRPFARIQSPPYSTKTQLENLCFTKQSVKTVSSDGATTETGAKPIALSDGSELERADITIIWRVKEGCLFDISQVDPKAYLREVGEGAVRSAANMLTKFYKQEYEEKNYRGIDALALIGSLNRWEYAILNGGSKIKVDDNGHEVFDADGNPVLEPIIDPNLTDQIDSEKYTADQIRAVMELKGVAQLAADVGIEVLGLTISSASLPESIQRVIDSDLIEVTEQMKYLKDTETLNKVVIKMIEASNDSHGNPTISYKDAMDFAIIAQEKTGATRTTINGNSTGADRIAAALAG